MRLLCTAVVLGLSVAFAGCGDAPPARSAQASTAAPPAAPTTTAAVVVEKTTALRRSQVKQTIGKGLGYFLQNVTVEDYPVMRGGKFHGFKIRTINAELGVDLRPGDVVTRVNGMAIEHPEEADAAMRTLDKAPALRVDYERDGKPQVLELPIKEE